MVRSKKGFTLTELIVVLVILSLIISISTVVFINVRKNALKKDYDNLVFYLEAKAEEYASDTNITTVSVDDLIKERYVVPDDGENIINPETNENMNCYIIKSIFESGKYEAKLSEKLDRINGTCKTYDKTGMFEMCEVSGNTCKSISNNKWFNKDITLGVKYANSDTRITNATFSWTSTNGSTSNSDTISAETKTVSKNTYKCQIDVDNIIGEAISVINIDKEKPIINSVSFDRNWQKEKEVVIDATDKDGSGVDKYSVVLENASCNYKDTNKIVVNKIGKYKYCVIDKAGNETFDYVEIDKIDSEIPKNPDITASDGKTQDKWHSQNFTLSFSSKNVVSTITYYYGTSKDNLNVSGDKVSIDATYHNKTIYVKACNIVNSCSGISSYKVLIDTVKPTIIAKNASVTIPEGEKVISTTLFNDPVFGVSGGSLTCNPVDTALLNLGTHTVTCTATGNNGLSSFASVSLTVEAAYVCSEGTLVNHPSLGYICTVPPDYTTKESCTYGPWDHCKESCSKYLTSKCLQTTKVCTSYSTTCITMYGGKKICFPGGACNQYYEYCSKYEEKEVCVPTMCDKCVNIPILCHDGWTIADGMCYKNATKAS